jgi:hypothetical protein
MKKLFFCIAVLFLFLSPLADRAADAQYYHHRPYHRRYYHRRYYRHHPYYHHGYRRY